jgi:hypothetical protein
MKFWSCIYILCNNIIVLIFFHYSISTVIPMNKIFNIFKITLLLFFIEMLQYDWLWSCHMIIKEMFYIPIKLKPELARASMTTSDVNNQWWTEAHVSASYKMCFGPRFYTPIKLQKNAFHSYNYILITPKFNIVEFFVVNFICVRLKGINFFVVLWACKSGARSTFFRKR